MKPSRYFKAKESLNNLNLDFDINQVSTVRHRSPNEDFLHFILKSIIGFHINKQNRNYATEVPISNGAIVDVIDLDENIGYEVQKTITEEWKKKVMSYPINVKIIPSDDYKNMSIDEIYYHLSKVII